MPRCAQAGEGGLRLVLQSADDVTALPDFNIMAVHVLLGMVQGSVVVFGLKVIAANDTVVLVEQERTVFRWECHLIKAPGRRQAGALPVSQSPKTCLVGGRW